MQKSIYQGQGNVTNLTERNLYVKVQYNKCTPFMTFYGFNPVWNNLQISFQYIWKKIAKGWDKSKYQSVV